MLAVAVLTVPALAATGSGAGSGTTQNWIMPGQMALMTPTLAAGSGVTALACRCSRPGVGNSARGW